MGNTNSRQSSIIRCLTGVPRETDCEIERHSSPIILKVHVKVRSLQESHCQLNHISQAAAEGSCQNVLVSVLYSGLQWTGPSGVKRIYPPGVDYLRHYLSCGWSIKHVVCLDVTTPPFQLFQGIPTPYCTGPSLSTPSNAIAMYIRNGWGWM